MKSVLFASAAAVAVLAAVPAFAETAPTGYVGASYGRSNLDTPIGSADADTWGLEGSAAFGLGDGLGAQLDANYANTDVDGFGSADTWGLGGHLFTRNDSYALGGFAGWTDNDGTNGWSLGVEGQKYLDNVTLAGSFGYGKIDDADVDYWSVGGEARYFVSDNFRLQGNLGWARVNGFGGDADLWSAGVGGEYQFDKAPVSVYANYAHTELNDADLKADTFTVGVRYAFGGTTLKSRDRSGASFTGLTGPGALASAF
jgi:hypothetical protein